VGEQKETSLWVLFLGAFFALLVLAFSYVGLVDDAYISFRYSHNLAAGEGLVFNPGEYVEGYTSLTWTLLMAIPEAFGLPTPTMSAYAGAAFALLALFECWRTLRLLRLPAWAGAAALAVLGTYPHFWMASTMGLEGGLFAFLLALSVRLTLSGEEARAGLVGGLMFATRPEALLLLAPFALYAFFSADGGRLVRIFRLVIPWLGLAGTLTLWRLYYYGAWVPNTITAKSPPERDLATVLANASEGASYLSGFAWSALPLVMGGVLAVLLRPRTLASWLCLGASLAVVPAVLINGGDWMGNYRLVAVYAPVLAVSLGLALSALGGLVRGRSLRLGVALALVLWTAFLPREHWWNPKWDPTPDVAVAGAEPCWQEISEELKPALSPSDVVSTHVLGLISYENPNVYFHDPLGLTDRRVALEGDSYSPTFGKKHYRYTYHGVRPDLLLNQFGRAPFFREMAAVSGGTYDERYATYKLVGLTACPPKTFVVAIRREDVPRVLPALAPFEPRPVGVTPTKAKKGIDD
jgi:hypothetical protein